MTLALTFDDGPDPRGTPAVLDALEDAGVTATFFVLGERVDAESGLLRRVIEAGHAVEVHGYEHLRHPHVTREEVEADIDRALDVIGGAQRWRIPWGHLADFTNDVATERGLEIVGWTTDTHDWRGDPAERDARAARARRTAGSCSRTTGSAAERDATPRSRRQGSFRCWSNERASKA